MKTEDLIHVLAAAANTERVVPIGRRLFMALLIGVALSVVLSFALLEVRPDIAAGLLTVPFVLKVLVAVCLAATAAAILPDTARPLPSFRRRWLLLSPPLLLAGGVLSELSTVPADARFALWIGQNAIHCLLLIPLLSCVPAVCLFLALRRGAPAHPARAGAVAGLSSAGVAAALYAFTCPDDSPLFVATWYSLATGMVTAASAWAGSRMLRW